MVNFSPKTVRSTIFQVHNLKNKSKMIRIYKAILKNNPSHSITDSNFIFPAVYRSLYSNMVKILLYIQKATEIIFDVAIQSDIWTNGAAARNVDTYNMHTSSIGL